ncbi:hypothetical protein [Flavobacterium oreochromis]|uniref:Uncharacterized protein n=1 Tax=Flavobacterium columnare TaxID=996 RepID=A0A246G7F9_9FLAO|nr:hypothetical protein [Flavobacterium oreochromis]OWP74428.1 hypothetical protein BWK62_14335 [Flavobacterium oreochromis]
MKKKSIIILSMFCFVLLESCNSQTKKNQTKSEKPDMEEPSIKEIDLLNLKYIEKITDILKSSNLDLKEGQETDAPTIFGYKKFESKSSKILKISNKNLSKGDNKLILHYNEENNVVKLLQIFIYTEDEQKGIIEILNSNLGKTTYQTEKKGNVQDVINGELVDTNVKYREKISCWEKNNIIYFCSYKTYSNNKNELVLFCFNKNDKDILEFIASFGSPYIKDSFSKK